LPGTDAGFFFSEAAIDSVIGDVIVATTSGFRFVFAGFDPGFLYLADDAGRCPLVDLNSVCMEVTVARTLSGISCMYTSVVVPGRECRRIPCTSLTVPIFWANVAMVRRITWKVYTAKGTERLERRASYFASKVGVQVRAVEVKELGYRWGSCSANGSIRFHWKTMMAPPKIIDYIVVHELCHLHRRDHDNAFWNEVDKVMQDYAERKAWLRDNGAALDV